MSKSTDRILDTLSAKVMAAGTEVANQNHSVLERCSDQADHRNYRFRLPNGNWVVISISEISGF